MSRRSRHGRHSQSNTADAPARPGTATVPAGEEPAEAAPFLPATSVPEAQAPAPVAEPRVESPRAAAPAPQPAVGSDPDPVYEPEPQRTTCTQAQLRRFIKSRPWIPMHELRRRFGIWGDDDDVSPVRSGTSTIFVGLPSAEARMLGDLLAGGDVGYELSLDPITPVVVGVYPMRPVPRG